MGMTLIFISVLFIVCQSVKIIPDMYELVCEKKRGRGGHRGATCQSTAFIDAVISVSNLMSVLNSAANFLVYMLRGRKFREAFLRTYGCSRTRWADAR